MKPLIVFTLAFVMAACPILINSASAQGDRDHWWGRHHHRDHDGHERRERHERNERHERHERNDRNNKQTPNQRHDVL